MQSSISFCVVLCLAMAAVDATICPNLRSAANFTVLAASTVTNTGNTIIYGNLGISPSVTLTGFNPPGVITGTIELGTGISLQGQKDATTTYNDLKGATLTASMTGVDLAGKTLTSGVYKFDTDAGISLVGGTLTLSGTGVFIFQVGTGLTTSADSQILLINGAKASCVFWQLGSSATLGQNSQFSGNILAYASVWLATGVTFNGSMYALTAAATFISNTVTAQASCGC